MRLRTKLYLGLVAVVVAFLGYLIMNINYVEKAMYDRKADIIGSHRTVTFYTTVSNQVVRSFTDKQMRVNYSENSANSTSFWLGSINRKVTSNLSFIMVDVVKIKKQGN